MSDESRAIAAQCWCDERTKHLVMEPELAEVFTEKLDTLQRRVEELETQADICETYPAYKREKALRCKAEQQRDALAARLATYREALKDGLEAISYIVGINILHSQVHPKRSASRRYKP